MEITAYTEEGIKALVIATEVNIPQATAMRRLILAWVDATARAEQLEHNFRHTCRQCFDAVDFQDRCEPSRRSPADWRQAVKDRIGWKD